MGSAVEWPVPGSRRRSDRMHKRIRQSIVVVLPMFLALFTDFARRWS